MTHKNQDPQSKLAHLRSAYRDLYLGSQTLLDLDSTYWTERLLLRLVNRIAKRRLEQIGEVAVSLPNAEADDQLRDNILEIQVEASLAGHDLSGWEETEDNKGFQAVCRRCGGSIYVSGRAMYSLLGDACGGVEGMNYDMFISYSTKDKSIADEIWTKTEAQGIRCWIAPRDISPGESWAESIMRAISMARIMVVVFSDSSNTSPSVIREVEHAVSTGATILLFRIDDTTLSPALRYFVENCRWFDALSPPMERHIEELVASVHTLLESGNQASSP